MGYPTKVQLIRRKLSQQWYINFPAALAQAMEFRKGEIVEWVIEDHDTLLLHRTHQGVEAEELTHGKKKR
jgi:bifunctional DNA-binding transcriptional regulator/antitoxin component of YhaV-PrlF toxin-antitoxin module